jgi:septation ring formation regulator EzrA
MALIVILIVLAVAGYFYRDKIKELINKRKP